MGKVDDMRAWNEWREYHRALKRDKAVDKLSPVERMRRLEKLEKDPVSWMLFFFAEYTRHPFTSFQKKARSRVAARGAPDGDVRSRVTGAPQGRTGDAVRPKHSWSFTLMRGMVI